MKGVFRSALLHHGASRGRVQFLLDEPEARTESEHVPEFRHDKAASHEEEVPQAGPCPAVLLQHQGQLERGHHGSIQSDALQPLAALVQLQVDVEDAATQATGLAGRQPQNLPSHAPCQPLWYQHRGAVQYCLLGPRQAALQHPGQLLTAPVVRDISRPRGLRSTAVPEVQLWGGTAHVNI